VIVVPNRGAPQSVRPNDAWISFINLNGSVRTPRWIGEQSPSERADLNPPLTLNHPLGSDGLVIMPDGTKYVSSVAKDGVSRIPPESPSN
jgi:hypothetical protein